MAAWARRLGIVALAASLALLAGSPEISASFGPDRRISFYNIHTKETVTVLYKKGGRYVPSAMERINWILRDWRRNEPTKMDPALVDLLWSIHSELGSREPIHVISGYRSRGTNDMLRRTSGGQARRSQHILGKAADVHFPDVPLRQLRYSALIRERGGVGYYPTSGIPFVHIDTGRVRHWPRLPRYELALLFPDGRTQHRPSDGRPISQADFRLARAHNKELAVQIARYHDYRLKPKAAPVLVAGAAPAARRAAPSQWAPSARVALADPQPPRLVAGPTLVSRRPRQAAAPARPLIGRPLPIARRPAMQGKEPVRLAAIDPGQVLGPKSMERIGRKAPPAGWPTGFAPAPAFDEEHPDEMSYRPFPIAPLLTETASPSDPVLSRLTRVDFAKVHDMLGDAESTTSMRLRPGRQQVELMWATEFRGDAVGLSTLYDRQSPADAPGVARKVRTSSR
ncbi:MAG: DUF882 domain-containing protein [Hyphomicrobiaceae bacterium]